MDLRLPTSHPISVLTVLGLHGVGPKTANTLLACGNTLGEIIQAAENPASDVIPTRARRSIREAETWQRSYATAESILDSTATLGIRVIVDTDTQYPPWLRSVADRSPLLFVKGTLPASNHSVACVGTRHPSGFGKIATARIVTALASSQWSIVSGLAVGVDSIAHRTALDVGAHTVAVLANGLDSVYPKQNEKLAGDILSSGGALVSEQPPGTSVAAHNLVARDRLQSGMAAGTIVMETGLEGGTMHTARFALLQGRLLFAAIPFGSRVCGADAQGNMALARMTGRELSSLVCATGEFARLLCGAFADRPVAQPINGRQDYATLNNRLTSAALAAFRTSRTAPTQPELFGMSDAKGGA